MRGQLFRQSLQSGAGLAATHPRQNLGDVKTSPEIRSPNDIPAVRFGDRRAAGSAACLDPLTPCGTESRREGVGQRRRPLRCAGASPQRPTPLPELKEKYQ